MNDRSVVLLRRLHTDDLMNNAANNDAILRLRRGGKVISGNR